MITAPPGNRRQASARASTGASLALVGLFALVACTSITRDTVPPRFALADLQPLEANLIEQRFLIGVRVTNPNDHAIRVRGGEADLQVNGIDFAQGITDQDQTIDAYGDAIVYVTATTNLAKLLEQLGRIAADRALSYRLRGELKLDRLPVAVPFEDAGEIKLDELLKIAPPLRRRTAP